MHVANVLLPIFLMIALGAVLRRTRVLGADSVRTMNWLCYWVGLPCVLLRGLAGRSFSVAASAGWVLLVVVAGMSASIVVAGVIAWAGRLQRGQVGAFVQASFRGNLAFVGLAVVGAAFPDGPQGERSAMTTAVLVLGPLVVIYNVVAVSVLAACRDRFSVAVLGRIARGLATNPLVIACVLGAVISAVEVRLPLVVDASLELVGRFALPVALLCVGGALMGAPLGGRRSLSVAGGVIKVAAGPLAGWAVGAWLGLTGSDMAVAMILLATPTAVASYVLTDQMDGDGPLAASVIAVSTALSVVSLGVVLAVYG